MLNLIKSLIMNNVYKYLGVLFILLFRALVLFAGPFISYGEWKPEARIAAWAVTIFMAFYLIKERLFLFGILVFLFGPLAGMKIFGDAFARPLIVLFCTIVGCFIAAFALRKGNQKQRMVNSYSYSDAEGGTILSKFFDGEI